MLEQLGREERNVLAYIEYACVTRGRAGAYSCLEIARSVAEQQQARADRRGHNDRRGDAARRCEARRRPIRIGLLQLQSSMQITCVKYMYLWTTRRCNWSPDGSIKYASSRVASLATPYMYIYYIYMVYRAATASSWPGSSSRARLEISHARSEDGERHAAAMTMMFVNDEDVIRQATRTRAAG